MTNYVRPARILHHVQSILTAVAALNAQGANVSLSAIILKHARQERTAAQGPPVPMDNAFQQPVRIHLHVVPVFYAVPDPPVPMGNVQIWFLAIILDPLHLVLKISFAVARALILIRRVFH